MLSILQVYCPYIFHGSAFRLGFDKVTIKRDVGVIIVAEHRVFSLALKEANPHLVVSLQLQHEALALHDGAIAGLSVQDGHLLLVLHHVQVRLLLVPGVSVQTEEVDARDVAEELAGEHVEMAVQVDEFCVEDQGLIVIVAVQGFLAAHGEGSVVGFAWFAGGTDAALRAFNAIGPPRAGLPCPARFPIRSPQSRVSLFPYKGRNLAEL